MAEALAIVVWQRSLKRNNNIMPKRAKHNIPTADGKKRKEVDAAADNESGQPKKKYKYDKRKYDILELNFGKRRSLFEAL